MNQKQHNEIHGYIERITFQNDENGYTVAQLKQPKHIDLVCVVGMMPGLQPGETVRLSGVWKHHLVHGRQFEVEKYAVVAPSDLVGVQKYLGSGLIKGIGPTYARRIIEVFGIETLHVIDQSPHRLGEVPGIGKKRVQMIQDCWVEQKSIREVMIFLQTAGISPAYAQKIFKRYGNKSIEVIKENPFCLAKDVFGIGFKKADSIAQNMGIAKDSPRRMEAGILYVLQELSSDGHVCYPVDQLLMAAQETLEVDGALVSAGLETLKTAGAIMVRPFLHGQKLEPFAWLVPLYMAEMGIRREFNRLKKGACGLRTIDMERALLWVQDKLKIQLAESQKGALAMAMTDKLSIITGGPGTGKSTITNAILTLSEKLTSRILLAAPTGRAAKRMSEITGRKASTIHSLLEFDFKNGGFKRNWENPLECDLIIVDEASMIDTLLMYSLLKAIPTHARVIFVGDIHQLPSVGPGNVLKDIIASEQVPVMMLTEIFRQAAGSQIIVNAHRINQGQVPHLQNTPDSDFFFMEAEDPQQVLDTVVGLVANRLPRKYGFDPIKDIQVLAPMRKGVMGIENLNAVLQQVLNPRDNPLFRAGRKFLVGDKVMQIRNDYKKEVFNGDVGRIEEIDVVEQSLTVSFDDRIVEYEFADLDELVLAYAVSVHKYQGSECPCVVMPVHTSHFIMLHRNLLYTGVTRGKKIVVLVGTKKALVIGVKNDEVKQRYTALKQALKGMLDD